MMKSRLLYIAAMATLCLASCASKSAEQKTTQQEHHFMAGAYADYRELTDEDRQLFKSVYTALPALTPHLVATQVVAGLNYKFICIDAYDNELLVVIYQPLTGHGEPQLTSITAAQDGEDYFLTTNGTPVLTHCIKHGTLSLHVGEKWIYVDPVTEQVPPVTDYTTMPKADLILITHAHHDHLDTKAIEQLTQEATAIIANSESAEQLDGGVEVMKNGDSRSLDAWMIEAVPAYNTSVIKQKFHPKGRDNGYLLTVDDLCIYIAGDTEPIPEMANMPDIDIAFLPCNLPFTMTPEQLAEMAKTIHPKVLFPYHYGKTDIQQVVMLLDSTDIDIRIRQYQ